MTLKNFSSSDKGISISGAPADTSSVLKGLKKDVRKRWLMVGVAGAVAVAMGSAWMTADTPKRERTPPKPERAVVETTPKGLSDSKDWRAQTGAELLAIRKAISESTASQQELLKQLAAVKSELEEVKRRRQEENPAPEPKLASSSSSILLPDPPAPPPPRVSPLPDVAQPTPPALTPPHTAEPAPTFTPPEIPPAPVKRAPARAFLPEGSHEASEELSGGYQAYEKNDKAGFLPAGSFAKATMISGVEAFTGGTAQSQPQPVVIRLDANAVLPNAGQYQIRGCHVLASVWGDMSSERVFGRLATLTCVDTNDNLVLSQEVEGVLVDSDGKNGIRGQLIDRQGAKLARSLLAGLAEGMSDALGAAQTTSLATGSGVTTAITGSSLASAGYGGASKAAEQLSDFYLKQAEATMPVIAVDAGRRISVLFTKSQSLKFESVDMYRPKVEDDFTVVRN